MDKFTYYKRNGEESSEAHSKVIDLLDSMSEELLDRAENDLANGRERTPFERRMLFDVTKALRLVSIMD